MTYVVTGACIGCRYGECVEVCPQRAFHEGPNFVVIDPVACANCSLCEMVCPVQAIRADIDLRDNEREYRELNERLARVWPIAENTQALADADALALDTEKRHLLQLPG